MARHLRAAALTALMALAPVTASAVTCTQYATTNKIADVSGKVPTSTACEISSATVDSAARVNSEKMFSFSDWQFLSRDNTDPTLGTPDEVAVPITMQITGTPLSGVLSLASNIWTRYTSLFLVLKAGGQNSNISGFVGYLLTPTTTSWSYGTPFLNAKDAPQQISHFTVYGRGTPLLPPPPPPPAPVPAPASLPLLGGAVGLMGLVLRGKRRST